MDLFDDYVRWLRLLLPKDQRDDILRELTEEYRSQVTDKEAELGRPLSRDEQARVIAQFGHPLLTAARYRPERYLIGPAMFPLYWPALKVTLGLAIAVNAISGVVLLAGGAPVDVAKGFAALWTSVLSVFAWVTIGFAVAERQLIRSRLLDKWVPGVPAHAKGVAAHTVDGWMRGLDGVMRGVDGVMGGIDRGVGSSGPPWSHWVRRSRGPASISGFVTGLVTSVWWLLALKFPVLMFGGGAAILEWGPDMNLLFPVLVVSQVTALVEHFMRLTRPHDTRYLRVTRVVWFVNGALFLYLLLTLDHQWVIWRAATDVAARARFGEIAQIAGRHLSLVDLVNYAFSIAFVVSAAVGVFVMLKRWWRWLSGRGLTAAHV
jgi:hypothetical protein